MSLSKLSASLNDIPSVSQIPKQLSTTFKATEHETSDMKIKISQNSPDKNEAQEEEDNSPELNKSKNNLLENFGLKKNKKQIIQYDIENFDAMPLNSRESFENSGGLLRKLEKKALKYQGILTHESENLEVNTKI